MSRPEESMNAYREAARLRAQRSRARARARKRLARKKTDDAVVESAVCVALLAVGDQGAPITVDRRKLVSSVLSRAIALVGEAGIPDSREKVLDRLAALRLENLMENGR